MVQTMGMDMLQYRIGHEKTRRTASRQAATNIVRLRQAVNEPACRYRCWCSHAAMVGGLST